MPLALKRLLPPGPPATAREFVEGLGLMELVSPALRTPDAPSQARPSAHDAPSSARPSATPDTPSSARPYVLLNMVSTLDGRATLGGRSGSLGNQADRELFHGLRTAVDAVMVGAGTARAEHYRRLVRDRDARELRRERGLAEEPLACIVSGRLALTGDIPLLADPQARVAILTPSQASLTREPNGTGASGEAQLQASIEYIRAARDGRLDLPSALAELGERFAVRTVLCEGGPHLNAQLLSAGLVDELFLSLAAKLAGGDATSEALRILAGVDFEPPVELELLGVLENQSHLFLRYGVRSNDTRDDADTGIE
jgi:riboflavin-specific deaminase-like protein